MDEFNATINRHFNEERSVLLPIWHEVSRAEVAAYSPIVADIVGLDSAVGTEQLARDLYNVLQQ
jgi:hypothetical protein